MGRILKTGFLWLLLFLNKLGHGRREMGRKPTKPENRKTNVLRILLTEKDRARLDKEAKKNNLDTSTWARMKLLELVSG